MINYKKICISNIDDKIIDEIYNDLLKKKWHFVILDINGILKILTKEKSIFEINDEQQFIESYKQDTYIILIKIMKMKQELIYAVFKY